MIRATLALLEAKATLDLLVAKATKATLVSLVVKVISALVEVSDSQVAKVDLVVLHLNMTGALTPH